MLALLMASLALASPTGRRPALFVQTADDGSLPCPAGQSLVDALARRLPRVPVTTQGALGPDDLALTLVPEAGGWRLRVDRPSGQAAVTRVLRPRQPGCEELADTAALIVDRYLADLSWPGLAPEMEPLPPQPIEPLPAPPEPRVDRLEIAAGAAGSLGWPLAVSASFGGEISLRLAGRFHVGAEAWFGLVREIPAAVGGETRGVLRTQTIVAFATAGLCGRDRLAGLCAGALGGAGTLSGDESGRLYQSRRPTVALPVAGAFGRVGWALPAGFEVGAQLAVVAALGRAELFVEGTSARDAIPAVNALLSVRVGWILP